MAVVRLAALLFLATFAVAVPMGEIENDWASTQHPENLPPVPPFTCKKLPKATSKPTNARQLRFTDIDVVASVGDSITAAFAAENRWKLDGLREFRGISWATGGDSKYEDGTDAYTFPNFLQAVTGVMPKGASHGAELPIDAVRNKQGVMPYWGNQKKGRLDAAQSEAKIQDVPAQIDHLVSQFKSNNVDVENDWKVLTVLIGANNGCGACHGGHDDTPEAYYEQMNQVVGNITQKMPRTFVNLVQMFNVSGVYDQLKTSKYCMTIQEKFKECGCLMGTDEDRTEMDVALQGYNTKIEQVATEWNAKNLTDHYFAVQPAFRNMPVLSREYLSSVECFHPSYRAHAAFAIGLWNNMLSAPKDKATELIPGKVQFKCPTADQYLQ